jgi:hypothetical protein
MRPCLERVQTMRHRIPGLGHGRDVEPFTLRDDRGDLVDRHEHDLIAMADRDALEILRARRACICD